MPICHTDRTCTQVGGKQPSPHGSTVEVESLRIESESEAVSAADRTRAHRSKVRCTLAGSPDVTTARMLHHCSTGHSTMPWPKA